MHLPHFETIKHATNNSCMQNVEINNYGTHTQINLLNLIKKKIELYVT